MKTMSSPRAKEVQKAKKDLETGIERRREDSRRQILNAAMELFFEKGYNETTTRDIVHKTGILNGSLYNRFKSKDDILRSVVAETINDALAVSEKSLEQEKDLLVAVVLPAAMELYAASLSSKVAELFYEAHKNWEVVQDLIDLAINWAKQYLERYGLAPMDEECIRNGLMESVGAVGNVMGYYSHGGRADYHSFVKNLVAYASMVMRIPAFDINGTVGKIVRIMEAGGFVICGHQVGHCADPETAD
ncbi:MAG: TetR/AcrR family transcriptional regulator [Methanomethylophilus sp.]